MTRPTISSLPSSTSKTFAPDSGALHLAALFGLGVVLAGIHQAWDLKLGLPGHYGLIWMAAIMWSRHWSRTAWAATLAACGYVGGAIAFTGFGQHALVQAPVYALCALAVDLAWRMAGARLHGAVLAGVVGGLAFMLKPLTLIALAGGFALELGSLRHGPVFPLVTHFCFGLTGAVIGTLVWRLAGRGDPGS